MPISIVVPQQLSKCVLQTAVCGGGSSNDIISLFHCVMFALTAAMVAVAVAAFTRIEAVTLGYTSPNTHFF